jgi:oxygen-independent coproporphyrinogen-3 oxidase
MSAGIYIHIPFCESKCGYCDFYSVTDLSKMDTFLSALQKEILLVSGELNNLNTFNTIYIGGGTPSILSTEQLHCILELIHKAFSIQTNAEITIEVNPGTLNKSQLQEYKTFGINRLSIGVQSFNDQELQFLGRIHDAGQSMQIISEANKAGFENINIDLIYALPGQTLNSWKASMKKASELKPAHISAYNLTIEKDTPFYELKKQGKLKIHTEYQEEKFFMLTDSFLSKAGYQHYEISNFARGKENESKHNKNYWNHKHYLGFGPAAHSFWKNSRWGNCKSVREYYNKLNDNKRPLEFIETLSSRDLEFETIFLSLRTYKGLNLKKFQKKFEIDFAEKYKYTYLRLLDNDFAKLNNQYFYLTGKGMALYDEILPQFICN